ncbi:MAG: 3-hydroxyacyl-CoA dehydrogenase/enoyl-CoA hydratase family protein [Deltaproteobacteria bacterium]|nr:3-hydroxyacyl-CoA dehydrogenase/enoyl-CoA hydratase family protein [Deltaproteobacteria bacterium]
MTTPIKKVGVIGAGVMGKGIAAHLANCGIPSLLLDLERGTVGKALQDLPKRKPALLYDAADLALITPGSIDEDLAKMEGCDWVIEVIVEQLKPKQALYAKLDAVHRPGQIISSNTSGISWQLLTEGRTAQFKQHFCITHFFNPVRYLKLVELVGGADTQPEVLDRMERLLGETLGKGVVRAKDTPNFIANRIGVHAVMVALHQLAESKRCPAVVDRVMGPAMGRPKSAIFRTADLVGLDTLAHVADNTFAACPDDEAREVYRLPPFLKTMLAHNLLGEKSGSGFYTKTKDDSGERVILAYDVAQERYRPQAKIKTPSLGQAKDLEDVAVRIRTIAFADDDAGAIAWPLISESLVYAANRMPEIADDIVAIDRAMQWGFGWELGPFATWDALGVQRVVDRLAREGRAIPRLVMDLLAHGRTTFYETREGRRSFFTLAHTLQSVPTPSDWISLAAQKAGGGVVEANESAALVDLGDGVFCCEFRSKMNAIDEEMIDHMGRALDHVERNGVGLLFGNEGVNFCVGANLMLIYLEAQQQNWRKIEEIVRKFQGLCQRIRFSPKPVVAAPFQLTLGGGCEFVLAAHRVRAAAETYIGLVELGVGLVPAGAGCKNMLLHTEALCRAAHRSEDRIWMAPDDGGPFPKVRMAFEAIGYAKVATSAKEAQRIGYLLPTDHYTIDRDMLLADAKADLLALTPGYVPPIPRTDLLLPGHGGYLALVNAIRQARAQGAISDYDLHLGERLAHILTGSQHPNFHRATEEDVLDREREVFLSLCGEERTHARIQHMLMTGKPLRN